MSPFIRPNYGNLYSSRANATIIRLQFDLTIDLLKLTTTITNQRYLPLQYTRQYANPTQPHLGNKETDFQVLNLMYLV